MSCNCEVLPESPNTTTGCVCDGPGQCPVSGIVMAAHWHVLCRTKRNYFEAFRDGRGPGQGIHKPKPRFTIGAGDVIEWTLLKLARGDEQRLLAIGIRADRFIEWISRGNFKVANDGTCGCPQRKAWLNRVFPLWPIRWPRRKKR
jgi:hypothetical protein